MAGLTKKQIRALEAIHRRLSAVEAYIMADNVSVCRKGGAATTTLHYTRGDESVLYEVNKQVGTPLCGLREGIQELHNLIHPEREKI